MTIRLASRLLALFLMLAGIPAMAQDGLFSPRIIVNGSAITEFEFEQRVLLLTLFRTPGDIEEEARTGLINDRLQKMAGKALGIEVTPEALMGGMEEFASRANLTAEEFIAAIGEAGVAAETYRDFVEAGLIWREVVRARFVGRVSISDKEVDRAIAAISQSSSVRVLLSEIFIAAAPGNESSARAVARRLQVQLRGEEAFAKAAAQYSSGPTAGSGGQLGWQTLADLPADTQTAVIGLQPGRISDPVEVEGGIAIYLLREIEQGPPSEVTTQELDYALVNLSYANDPVAEAERLRVEADTCNDLNALVPAAVPDSGLQRQTQPEPQVPGDIADTLARLDPGETAPAARGGVPLLLMLCARNPILQTPVNRDAVRNSLLNQRLAALADGLLEELRADAIITEPGALPPPGENATE